MKESELERDQRKLAEFLFDGNAEKSEVLLTLIRSFNIPYIAPPEFKNIRMQVPEETCKWCKEGECLFNAPDSMFLCEGKCTDYVQK